MTTATLDRSTGRTPIVALFGKLGVPAAALLGVVAVGGCVLPGASNCAPTYATNSYGQTLADQYGQPIVTGQVCQQPAYNPYAPVTSGNPLADGLAQGVGIGIGDAAANAILGNRWGGGWGGGWNGGGYYRHHRYGW